MRKAILSKSAFVAGAVAGLAIFTTQSWAQKAADNPAVSPDSGFSAGSSASENKQAMDFLQEAARCNDKEIALAEIGYRKAENSDLKNFSQQLQQDHIRANDQLKPLAQKYGVTMDQEFKRRTTRELSRFEKMTSADFDKKFAIELLRSHQQTIDEFNKALQKPLPADVKEYAQLMLPKLQRHFQEAETTASKVGVDASTISSIAKKLPEGIGGTGAAQEPEPGIGSAKKTEKGAGAQQLDQPPSRPADQK